VADPLSQGERHRIYTILDAWARGQALPMRRQDERYDIADRVAASLDGGPVEVAIKELTTETRKGFTQLTERIADLLDHAEKPPAAQETPGAPGAAALLHEALAFVREHPLGCAVVWLLTWILIVGGSSMAGTIYEDLRVWGAVRREPPAVEAPIGGDLLDAAGYQAGPTPSGGALGPVEPVP
jgi:hypothetical protein